MLLPTLEALLNSRIAEAMQMGKLEGGRSQLYPIDPTAAELKELGVHLLEISTDWKRIVSPMLSYNLVQDALVLLLREAKWYGMRFKFVLASQLFLVI